VSSTNQVLVHYRTHQWKVANLGDEYVKFEPDNLGKYSLRIKIMYASYLDIYFRLKVWNKLVANRS
jgi:hypothetical protein